MSAASRRPGPSRRPTPSWIGEGLARHRAQPKCVVEFAIGQQSGIGGFQCPLAALLGYQIERWIASIRFELAIAGTCPVTFHEARRRSHGVTLGRVSLDPLRHIDPTFLLPDTLASRSTLAVRGILRLD
jgi:hypothetical protein